MNKILVTLGLALFIVGVCLVTTGSALNPIVSRGFNATYGGHDNFQYENDNELSQHWVVTPSQYGSVSVSSNYPVGYTYNKYCFMQSPSGTWGGNAVTLKSKNCSASNYWGFDVLYYTNVGYIIVYLYDYDNVLIGSFYLSSYIGEGEFGLWEFVRIDSLNDIYFYINGVNTKTGGGPIITGATKEIGYIGFHTYKVYSVWAVGTYIYFDNFNNYGDGYGGCVGLGSHGYDYLIHEDDPTAITFTYTLQHYPDSTFGYYVYKLKVINYDTGELISSETITEDHGYRNFNRESLLGYNYGHYRFFTEKDGSAMYYEDLLYIPPGGEGSSVAFTEDRINIGENTTITHSIANYDSINYDYTIEVKSYVKGSDVIETFSLDSASGSVEWNTEGQTQGYYLAYLRRITKVNPANNFIIGSDYALLTEVIRISGYTYNAITGATLAGVDVIYKQGATTFSDTSNASGYYMVEDLEPEYTLVNASKTSYTHSNWTYTAVSGYQTIDLYLFPADMSPYPRVAGLVLTYPYNQALEGATVNIFNDSWSDTNTTTALGFYEFDADDDIIATYEYTMNATKTGFFPSNDTNVTVAAAALIKQYFFLEPSLTLTLKAKDGDNGGYLSTFNATIEGNTYSTTDGTLEITPLTFKWYEMTVQSPGYNMLIIPFLLEEDRTMEVDLYRIPSATVGGVGTYLPPHAVSFTVQDIFGRKKEDVTVTLSYQDTTLNDYSTLLSTYGYSEEMFSANESMSGITDSQGLILFTMIPAARYEIKFKNDALDIDKKMFIYPKEDKYTVLVSAGLFGGVSNWLDEQHTIMGNEVIITFSVEQISEAKCYLNIVYNDTTGNTNSVYFYVNSSNNTILNTKSVNLNYYEYSYLVSNISGNTFIYGLKVDHGRYGELEEAKVVYFVKRLVVIDGWSEIYYLVAGIAISFLIGIVFSGYTVKNGAVVFPIFCWIFWYMGWMNYTGIEVILGIIMTLGVAYYITAKGREERIT